MAKQLRILMIAAHPDDNDFRCGGTALKYVAAGHDVRFLSVCDGSGGHQTMTSEGVRERRRGETLKVQELTGITYDVWDIPDCEVMADLETRKRLIRYIRNYNPDLIITHRNNDYHADHRNVALLVQDASYLLIVPLCCPDTPAMKETPVIMYSYDGFKNPSFYADVVVATDDVVDKKYEMFDCHVSQVYEWLPFTEGGLDEVPEDPKERLEWLRSPRMARDRRPKPEDLIFPKTSNNPEAREARAVALFPETVERRYGKEAAEHIIFGEGFMVCEYGAKLTPEKEAELFPF